MHPHRGMDTVMYVKCGTCGHRDSMGNSGVLTDGDCQWMTAASGIEHDEGTGHPGGETVSLAQAAGTGAPAPAPAPDGADEYAARLLVFLRDVGGECFLSRLAQNFRVSK